MAALKSEPNGLSQALSQKNNKSAPVRSNVGKS